MRHKRSNPKKPDPALPAVLQRLRHDNGWTQEGLAFEADLTIATLSRIERGVTDPAWSSIRAITRALGMGLDELGAAIELEEQPLPPAEI
jgi:transcriptional regulator with XRE-family HTH domain